MGVKGIHVAIRANLTKNQSPIKALTPVTGGDHALTEKK